MTSLLERPATTSRSAGPARSRLQLAARGGLAAFSVLAVVAAALLVLVLIAWAADARSAASAGTAARVALSIILLAARVPLRVAGGTVALPPLGLTLVIGVWLARSAGSLAAWWTGEAAVVDLRDAPPHAGAPPVRDIVEVVAAVAVPYAALSGVLAASLGAPALRPSVVGSVLCSLVFAAGAATLGVLRAGLLSWPEVLPDAARRGIGGGLRGAGVLAVGGALLVLGSLAWHAGTMHRLLHAAGGGVVGSIGLTAICIAVLPNAVLAAVGYLAGSGLSVGVGTSVGLGGVHLGGLPALPLLAAVPHGAAPTALWVLTWVVVAGAGAVAALRPGPAETDLVEAAVRTGVAAATAGLLAGLAVAIAGGPAGPGGLATIGASGWRVGLFVTAEVLVGSLLTLGVRSSWAAVVDVRRALQAD
jgi:hypothetical protein